MTHDSLIPLDISILLKQIFIFMRFKLNNYVFELSVTGSTAENTGKLSTFAVGTIYNVLDFNNLYIYGTADDVIFSKAINNENIFKVNNNQAIKVFFLFSPLLHIARIEAKHS